MDNLKDPQFLVTIAILLSSAVGNYFAITSKFEIEIKHLKEVSEKHVDKEPYEVRSGYIENELAKHDKRMDEMNSYLIQKYPDWREYKRLNDAKDK